MAFQSTVNFFPANVIPGEFFMDGPVVSNSWTLESSGTPNLIGATAYTYSSDGVAAAGGTANFVGILANPKVYSTNGTSSGALNPSMQLPDGSQGELVTSAPALGITVTTTGAAFAPGSWVQYNNTTGALSLFANGGSPTTGNTRVIGAETVLFTVPSGATTAIIRLTGQI